MSLPSRLNPSTFIPHYFGALLISGLLTAFCSSPALSQQPAQAVPRVLFSVDQVDVSVDEFLSVFNKNNYTKKAATREELEEYLGLYVKFKLKVQEAYARGMDTTAKFRREFDNYRDQLAQPYLRDKHTGEELLQEAFQRSRIERRASHIMIRIEENASPADSLASYNKAVEIHKQLLSGADFESLAREKSEDPSAKENRGDLGYFSAFRMIYPFENMAYQTRIGGVSPVFRTQFGYHVLKVTDERPARGEIRVAHLMLLSRNVDSDSLKESARRRIFEIDRRIKAGESFDSLVKQHSEDPSSSGSNGLLPYFGTGRMVPEFENAAYALTANGDISDPIQTAYGWHIMKRVDLKAIPTLEESKADLEAKIARDSRANRNKSTLLAKLKKEYSWNENDAALGQFISTISENSYRDKSWEPPMPGPNDPVLCHFADTVIRQNAFAQYLNENKGAPGSGDFGMYLRNTYREWTDEQLLAYEDAQLERKYPEFRSLVKEYREGILLFDLTDELVWSKAVNDTVGLKAFFEGRREHYRYGARIEGAVYVCRDDSVALAVRKAIKSKKNTSAVLLKSFNASDPLSLRIIGGKLEKQAHEVLSRVEWKKGISDVTLHNGQKVFVQINRLIPPGLKQFSEIRGLVTSDYQQQLEAEWVKSLENKYKVDIRRDVFQSILPR
ncbi:MAG: peptidylprolyl isomerase [Sphingomonadales bacterium]|nr:peptidylprolyl isomerase [Sphingomonadales bacterium]